ncbi:MAG: hypothetical protein LW636_06045 [Planctomycetaceae bacterium]|nr:hypothetical protein [Planctomycetaceae bacterium]
MTWLRSCLTISACVLVGWAATSASSAQSSEGAAAAPSEPKPAKPLRVAVIGASASAGFGCSLREERGGETWSASFRLIDMVRLACPELEILSTDMSSGFFFLAPVRNGARAVQRAQEFRPDCVVALDFLFWYGYGDDGPEGKRLAAEDERLAKFELGLAELAKFTVPVFVGDMPDMSPAVGRMLSRTQMPAVDTIARMNDRLKEWAHGRANVRVLPLSKMQAQLMADDTLDIAGARLESSAGKPLLQNDRLHPAPLGLAGLACAIADELRLVCEKPDEGCEPEPEGTYERARGELRKIAPRRPAAPKDAAKPSAPEKPATAP